MPGQTNQPNPVSRGDRVGEWVLQEPVGGGAFGAVWRAAHHAWSDQRAAVKLPSDPAYVRALRREGRFSGRLDHPNVVKPLGFDPFAERPYLVMEFVPGVDLRRHLGDRGPMRPADAVAVLKQVLAALGYAHGQGVVHRDVKPENVLVHERVFADPAGFDLEGGVKVTDFGLGAADNAMAEATANAAANAPAGGARSIVFSADLPAGRSDGGSGGSGGSIAGSLDYMAPEQRGGGEVDGRADLYACGVMLFEMLTGERPAGTDVPSDLVKGVPPHLDEAFRRSYARLDKRFATAADFAAALEPRRAQAGLAPVPVPARPGACPACEGRVADGDQFCMQCGKQLVGVVRRCGKCGAFPSPEDHYCMFCGHHLSPPRTDALA